MLKLKLEVKCSGLTSKQTRNMCLKIFSQTHLPQMFQTHAHTYEYTDTGKLNG